MSIAYSQATHPALIYDLEGFDYGFETLSQGETDELVRAFMDLFAPMENPPIFAFLADVIPLLRLLVRKFLSYRH